VRCPAHARLHGAGGRHLCLPEVGTNSMPACLCLRAPRLVLAPPGLSKSAAQQAGGSADPKRAQLRGVGRAQRLPGVGLPRRQPAGAGLLHRLRRCALRVNSQSTLHVRPLIRVLPRRCLTQAQSMSCPFKAAGGSAARAGPAGAPQARQQAQVRLNPQYRHAAACAYPGARRHGRVEPERAC
jgi:hypothetical protein